MRRGITVGFWFVATFSLIITTFYLLTLFPKPTGLIVKSINTTQYKLFSALPDNNGYQKVTFDKSDGRSVIVKNFLTKHKSPLVAHSDYLVWIADINNLDFRLIPAIAMKETNAGRKINQDTYNAWGFANGLTRFKSWPDAIDKVALTLKKDYIDKGLTTPETIMPKYAPPSVAKGGPWARGVQQFMNEME